MIVQTAVQMVVQTAVQMVDQTAVQMVDQTADRMVEIQAILQGTCNYLVSRQNIAAYSMSSHWCNYRH